MTPAHTAPCGIYCPDCILLKNQYSGLARRLRQELDDAGMRHYAAVQSSFGSQDLSEYPVFTKVLDTLCDMKCPHVCREGGGCGGMPCAIMLCCKAKGYAGCWECDELDACTKFGFLEPRCGSMPKDNCRLIRENGLDGWEQLRKKFYVWL